MGTSSLLLRHTARGSSQQRELSSFATARGSSALLALSGERVYWKGKQTCATRKERWSRKAICPTRCALNVRGRSTGARNGSDAGMRYGSAPKPARRKERKQWQSALPRQTSKLPRRGDARVVHKYCSASGCGGGVEGGSGVVRGW